MNKKTTNKSYQKQTIETLLQRNLRLFRYAEIKYLENRANE